MTSREERQRMYNEQIARSARIERMLKLTRTYLEKAEHSLYAYKNEKNEIVEPLPTGYYHRLLLDQALDFSLALIKKLPDAFFEETQGMVFSITYNLSDDVLEKVNKLLAALDERRKAGKKKRRIEALENITGRTPEEAELYMSKARELRDG